MSSLPPNNVSTSNIIYTLNNINTADIKSGTLDIARIPNLDAGKITSGTLTVARIPALDAGKITTGSLHSDRIPGLNASKINTGTFNVARIPSLNYAPIGGSTASGSSWSASYLHIRGGWYICQNNYLFDEYPKINISDNNWGNPNHDDLVFTRNTDKSTVWISVTGNNTTDAVNITGQHGLFSLDKKLNKCVGYIACVSSEGYWDEEQKYYYKNKKIYITINDSLPMIRLSNKKNEKSVIGVISDKRQNFNTSRLRHSITYIEKAIVVNSIGEGAIWVSNYNGSLENGDYITSSDIPGIGMKQDDDLLHNYTVAKITMDCDFNPEYIPIQKTIFDENNDLIFENEYDEQSNIKYDYEYEMKYIRLNCDIIDKTTYEIELSSNLPVYKMAFVGCTYHCG